MRASNGARRCELESESRQRRGKTTEAERVRQRGEWRVRRRRNRRCGFLDHRLIFDAYRVVFAGLLTNVDIILLQSIESQSKLHGWRLR